MYPKYERGFHYVLLPAPPELAIPKWEGCAAGYSSVQRSQAQPWLPMASVFYSTQDFQGGLEQQSNGHVLVSGHRTGMAAGIPKADH